MSNDSTPNKSHEQRLELVLAEYLRSVEAGTPLDREQLVGRHPDLADELRSFFANRDALEWIAQPLKDAALEPTQGAEASAAQNDPSRVRYFGDYELLEEIARGGMGVVYRARQVSLKRIVALKMILAGQLASETDVRRFRAEAEAAANLNHPNILPIYEVGEHQGQHYFSMKLVTEGSLAARMPELQTDPRTLIALLVQVARAVHFAHQRGVLHRDLKPGNVLLDSQTPFVADFGLAKRVEGDSTLTASGAIVGSPSYMPPEQARAEKSLTVAADVYSLGAILYEMLTGRPPFRGASPIETLLQVLEQEPKPPRKVNPAVARDLESVCLKCLAKEPLGRYANAGELADDLERWLAGEAVSARPPTRSERFARWTQRNPVLFALAFAMLIGVGAAPFIPKYTEGPLPQGVLIAFFLTAFFSFMMLLGRNHSRDLEKRLRQEHLETGGTALPETAVPAPPADAVPRSDLLRSSWRGARNGAFLSAGAAGSVITWAGAWEPLADPRNLSRDGLELRPEAIVAAVSVVVIAVLGGAAGAMLVRTLVRPFGRIAWGVAWLVAGIAVAMGTSGVLEQTLYEDMAKGKWYPTWLLIAAPAAAVVSDWWTRHIRRTMQTAAAAGQVSLEHDRILAASIPLSDLVVQNLPLLLLFAGVIAGHFAGAAISRPLAPRDLAEIWTDLGALIGRVAGSLSGAVVTMWLLHFYRVEASTPWPGQGERRYPRALAALYLLATAIMAVAYFWKMSSMNS